MKIAVDDFGTGYSSLNYIRRFPVDILKVDKSFVDGVNEGGEESALTAAIIELAAILRLRPVAGGIERADQLEKPSPCDATSVRASTSRSRSRPSASTSSSRPGRRSPAGRARSLRPLRGDQASVGKSAAGGPIRQGTTQRHMVSVWMSRGRPSV